MTKHEDDEQLKGVGSTDELGGPEIHHIWCNYAGAANECEMCKRFNERYPMNGASGDELAEKYFPDAIKRA